MMVGPTQNPSGQPSTFAPRPSTSTLPPSFSASSMNAVIRLTSSRVMIGPMSVPTLSLPAMATMRSTMRCTSPTATITVAAMQRWPEQP